MSKHVSTLKNKKNAAHLAMQRYVGTHSVGWGKFDLVVACNQSRSSAVLPEWRYIYGNKPNQLVMDVCSSKLRPWGQFTELTGLLHDERNCISLQGISTLGAICK